MGKIAMTIITSDVFIALSECAVMAALSFAAIFCVVQRGRIRRNYEEKIKKDKEEALDDLLKNKKRA